jgi:hypothetical protein
VEQRALKNVNNCLNTNIYSYFETSGSQSSSLYLNVVHFSTSCLNEKIPNLYIKVKILNFFEMFLIEIVLSSFYNSN